MRQSILSEKKANKISNGIFLISLGILVFTNAWWPGIILAIWASVGSRQYLTGRIYQAILSTFILLGVFFTALYKFNFETLAPVLLIIGGVFIIVREYAFGKDTNGEEKSEEIKDDADIE